MKIETQSQVDQINIKDLVLNKAPLEKDKDSIFGDIAITKSDWDAMEKYSAKLDFPGGQQTMKANLAILQNAFIPDKSQTADQAFWINRDPQLIDILRLLVLYPLSNNQAFFQEITQHQIEKFNSFVNRRKPYQLGMHMIVQNLKLLQRPIPNNTTFSLQTLFTVAQGRIVNQRMSWLGPATLLLATKIAFPKQIQSIPISEKFIAQSKFDLEYHRTLKNWSHFASIAADVHLIEAESITADESGLKVVFKEPFEPAPKLPLPVVREF